MYGINNPCVFLVGFMGAGKTTFGKKLANHLRYPFIDLDQMIEKKVGMSVAEIIDTKGIDYFRKTEAITLRGLSMVEPMIVSVGGGTPCYYENMDWMCTYGRVIYLELSPKALCDRLMQSKTDRPLLRATTAEETLARIKDLLSERVSFYEEAHLTINPMQTNALELAAEIA